VARLFVGNLPYKATESDLEGFFADAGVQVDSVNIMRDRFSGEARGFGFVEINDDNAANQAVQSCNGRQFMGRALVVNEARPAERREFPTAAAAAVVTAVGVVAVSGISAEAAIAGNLQITFQSSERGEYLLAPLLLRAAAETDCAFGADLYT